MVGKWGFHFGSEVWDGVNTKQNVLTTERGHKWII